MHDVPHLQIVPEYGKVLEKDLKVNNKNKVGYHIFYYGNLFSTIFIKFDFKTHISSNINIVRPTVVINDHPKETYCGGRRRI
jgi:hypothetical protein